MMDKRIYGGVTFLLEYEMSGITRVWVDGRKAETYRTMFLEDDYIDFVYAQECIRIENTNPYRNAVARAVERNAFAQHRINATPLEEGKVPTQSLAQRISGMYASGDLGGLSSSVGNLNAIPTDRINIVYRLKAHTIFGMDAEMLDNSVTAFLADGNLRSLEQISQYARNAEDGLWYVTIIYKEACKA